MMVEIFYSKNRTIFNLQNRTIVKRKNKPKLKSNQIEESEVEITTSGPLILTMKIGRPESKCCGGGCS